jgi:hypothetical protein
MHDLKILSQSYCYDRKTFLKLSMKIMSTSNKKKYNKTFILSVSRKRIHADRFFYQKYDSSEENLSCLSKFEFRNANVKITNTFKSYLVHVSHMEKFLPRIDYTECLFISTTDLHGC